MKFFKFFILATFISVFMFSAISIRPAHAFSGSGSVTVGCTGITDNGSFYTADRNNTGMGQEAYRFYITDGYGNLIYDFSNMVPVGFGAAIGSFLYTSAPAANPITMYFVSLAGNGFGEQEILKVEGSCAGLPTVPRCQLNVPAGSVVGEAPLGAYIYYAPGAATDLILKPGTYIVVGQDASQTYYKIVLACQFIWVRKDTMQPSPLPPQNGAPLPTRIVQ
ncbi:MAG: hypothetical protein CUN52_05205 [Phototrophicales bacterium]|nr:MAG: hypothetical protein CUN52_05205 [Phototrophicales bacterium]